MDGLVDGWMGGFVNCVFFIITEPVSSKNTLRKRLNEIFIILRAGICCMKSCAVLNFKLLFKSEEDKRILLIIYCLGYPRSQF